MAKILVSIFCVARISALRLSLLLGSLVALEASLFAQTSKSLKSPVWELQEAASEAPQTGVISSSKEGQSAPGEGGSLAGEYKSLARALSEKRKGRVLVQSLTLADESQSQLIDPPEAPRTFEGCALGLIKNQSTGTSINFISATGTQDNGRGTFLTSVSDEITPSGGGQKYYTAVGHFQSTPSTFRAFRINSLVGHNVSSVTPLALNQVSCQYTESFAFGVSEKAESIVGAGCVSANGCGENGVPADRDLRPIRWGCSNYSLSTIPPPSSWGQGNVWQRQIQDGVSFGNSGEATAVDGDGDVFVGWVQRVFPTPSSGNPYPVNNLTRESLRSLRGGSCSAAVSSAILPEINGGLAECDLGPPNRFACSSSTGQGQSGAFAVSRDGNLVVGYQRTREFAEGPGGTPHQCERVVPYPDGGALRQVASRAYRWDARCGALPPRSLLPTLNSRGDSDGIAPDYPACPALPQVYNWPRGVARGLSPDGSKIVGEDHSDRKNEFLNLEYPVSENRWVPRNFTNTGPGGTTDSQFDLGGLSQEAALWSYPFSSSTGLGWLYFVPDFVRDSRLRDASNSGVRMVGQGYRPDVFGAPQGGPTTEGTAVVTGIPSPGLTLRSLRDVLGAPPYNLNIDSLNDNSPSTQAKWQLVDARSISPNGKTIVGRALCTNQASTGDKSYGFIVRLPS
jgi:hypothetical protein